MMVRTIIFLMTLFLIPSAHASNSISLGMVADNITAPIEVVTGFVSVACLIVGVACLFAALVKYFEHRRSPLHVPFSTVVWLIIIAVLLLILPFAYIVTGNTAPFAFMWGG